MTAPVVEVTEVAETTSGPVARVLLAVVRFYRTAISPSRPPSCRYTPSCSAYAVEAIQTYGAGRGSWLALRRLLRCHPFHAGGHDPVPPRVGFGERIPLTTPSRPAARSN
jgi:putative membrane protein insertion efficiency factor